MNDLGVSALKKVQRRLIPFLALLYFAAFIDGWQWLFLTETIPSLVLGFATLKYLPDSPADAKWLTAQERDWLTRKLDAERLCRTRHRLGVLQALTCSRVLTWSLCYFGVEIGLYGVILWIPQILAHAGIAADSVGVAVAIPYAIAAAGMVW
jgi:ACS family tartrate transporter-like MFS transporter